MKNFLGLMFRRRGYRVGEGMRGRVHKISIIAGGEVSIVIRCGMDEPLARQLLQGSLVEFFETREGIPPAVDNIVGYEGRDAIPGTAQAATPHEVAAQRWAEEEADRQTIGDGTGTPVGLLDLGRVSDTGKNPAADDTQ